MQLYDMYPDKNMSIGLRSIHKPPLLSIMPEGINITVPAAVDFFVLDKNGPTLAFSLAIVCFVCYMSSLAGVTLYLSSM